MSSRHGFPPFLVAPSLGYQLEAMPSQDAHDLGGGQAEQPLGHQAASSTSTTLPLVINVAGDGSR